MGPNGRPTSIFDVIDITITHLILTFMWKWGLRFIFSLFFDPQMLTQVCFTKQNKNKKTDLYPNLFQYRGCLS